MFRVLCETWESPLHAASRPWDCDLFTNRIPSARKPHGATTLNQIPHPGWRGRAQI
jgi:hypothetical protein